MTTTGFTMEQWQALKLEREAQADLVTRMILLPPPPSPPWHLRTFDLTDEQCVAIHTRGACQWARGERPEHPWYYRRRPDLQSVRGLWIERSGICGFRRVWTGSEWEDACFGRVLPEFWRSRPWEQEAGGGGRGCYTGRIVATWVDGRLVDFGLVVHGCGQPSARLAAAGVVAAVKDWNLLPCDWRLEGGSVVVVLPDGGGSVSVPLPEVGVGEHGPNDFYTPQFSPHYPSRVTAL